MKMSIIFLLYIPLFVYSKSFSLPEIQRMVKNARDSLDGAVIDIYREYNFVGNRDGSSEETHHIIMFINEEEGINQADFKIHYNSSCEEPELITGRTIKPDGSITKMGEESARSEGYLEAIDMKLYSDRMVYILTPPAVEKGAIVEMVFKISTSSYPIKGEFWREVYIQESSALWRWKYIVRMPVKKEPKFVTMNFEGKCEKKIHGKMQEFIYSGGPHKAIKHEIFMPPPAFRLPRIAFSTLRSYDEFGKWYWGEIDKRIRPNRDMMMTIASLTYKTEDKLNQVKAICDFVSRVIRYAALEFHETAYIPTPASEVFECKYGDCKDKVALLISLLRIIDVDAYFVLISDNSRGQEIIDIPVFDQFSHAIVYIPEYNFWVDPTFPFSRAGEIPFQYQNRKALVISDSICEWRNTPVGRSDQNKTNSEIKINIDDEGNAEIVVREMYTGLMATLLRMTYRVLPKNMRETAFESSYAALFPNVTDISLEFSGIDSVNQELSCSTYLYSKNFAKKSGDLLIFNLPLGGSMGFDPTISLEERGNPIYLPMRLETYTDLKINFAPNYECVEKPDSIEIRTSSIESAVTLDYAAGEINISIYSRILDNYIEKNQFAELTKLLRDFNRFQNNPIILKLR